MKNIDDYSKNLDMIKRTSNIEFPFVSSIYLND